MKPISLVLLILWHQSWPRRTEACGTSTHISIAHEASVFFASPKAYPTDYAELIRTNQDAFVAGNPYPDAMYPSLCYKGKYHAVAEDTHWAPFLNATVNYIRQNYHQPWNQVYKLLRFSKISANFMTSSLRKMTSLLGCWVM